MPEQQTVRVLAEVKIRNESGHNWYDIDFDTPKIAALCLKLAWLGAPDSEDQSTPKTRLTMNVCMLLIGLLWRKCLPGS